MTSARKPRSSSLWADAWRRLRRNRMSVTCAVIFAAVLLFCYLGPLIAAWIDPSLTGTHQDMLVTGMPPSWNHWLGTDPLGRDMLVRTMQGGQIALEVGISATTVAIIIGVLWGATAAYAGGKTDEIMMRIVDVMYAFPTIVFVIVIMAVMEERGNIHLLYALIGAISWLTMARIVRGQVMSLRHREFIEAARALGVPPRRILLRHIIPNTLGPVIVYATLSIPSVMLTEAFLSFLGLGVQAPLASWGTLVTEGSSQMMSAPWTLVGPGIVMSVTIFSLNFLGDGLRDALDPQMRKD